MERQTQSRSDSDGDWGHWDHQDQQENPRPHDPRPRPRPSSRTNRPGRPSPSGGFNLSNLSNGFNLSKLSGLVGRIDFGNRKRMKIIGISAVVALVLLNETIAYGLPAIAQHEISSNVQLELDGTNPHGPKVSVSSFPMLLTVLSGNFRSVTVDVQGICTPGPRVADVNVKLKNVAVSIPKAISGQIPLNTIGSVNGTATVNYADINAYLNQYHGQPAIEANGKSLKLSLYVQRTGKPQVRVALDATIIATGRGFVIAATQLAIAGYGALNLNQKDFTFPVSLDGQLPANLAATSVNVTPTGVQLLFSGSHISLAPLLANNGKTNTNANAGTQKKAAAIKCLPPLTTPPPAS